MNGRRPHSIFIFLKELGDKVLTELQNFGNRGHIYVVKLENNQIFALLAKWVFNSLVFVREINTTNFPRKCIGNIQRI